jgi:hypothetical protein
MDRENFPFQLVIGRKLATRLEMRDSLIAGGLHDLRGFWKDQIRKKAQNSG